MSMVQCIQTGELYVAKSSSKNTRTLAQNEASLLKKINSPLIPKLKVSLESTRDKSLCPNK